MSISKIKKELIEMTSIKKVTSKSDIPKYILTLCAFSLFVVIGLLLFILASIALYALLLLVKQII